MEKMKCGKIKKRSTRGRFLRLTASLLLGGLLAALSVGEVLANTCIDTEKDCSLKVSFQTEAGSMEGVSFYLYKIADVDSYAEYTLLLDFDSSGIDIAGVEASSDWADIAARLSDFVAQKGIVETASSETDSGGEAAFNGLSVGLYLLLGGSVEANGHTYAASPTVIMLPMLDSDGEWVYNAESNVKYEVDSDGSKTPGTSGSGSSGTTTSKTLPLTGQLNWPIPLLSISGLFMILIGTYLRRRA